MPRCGLSWPRVTSGYIDFGEHPDYDAACIAHAVEVIYSVDLDGSRIRRLNINCAPLDVEGYRLMKKVGIGTYRIFQETYHRPTYARVHERGPKADFLAAAAGQDQRSRGLR